MSQSGDVKNTWRLRRDRWARRLIAVGGWMVLVLLGLLIWHLVYVVWPLTDAPALNKHQTWPLPEQQLLLPGGPNQDKPAVLYHRQHCQLLLADGGNWQTQARFPLPCSTRVKALAYGDSRYLFQLSQDGLIRVMQFKRDGDSWQKVQRGSFNMPEQIKLSAVQQWHVAVSDSHYGLTVQTSDQQWLLKWVNKHNPLHSQTQSLGAEQQVHLLTAMKQAVATSGNQIKLIGSTTQSYTLTGQVDAVHVLPGDKAVLLSLSNGEWQKWALTNRDGQFHLRQAYKLTERQRLVDVAPRTGADLLILLEHPGRLLLMQSTTGVIMADESLQAPADSLTLNGDALMVMGPEDIQHWQLSHVDSVVSFATLWQPLLYDGYDTPAYVWQSTTASDQGQAKYSLVPLVIGSLKAALVALVVAVPLALGAAIYSAYFVPPRLRNWLKPGIEMLEAIPSVVIGFIAAIWLTPVVEQYLFGLLLFLLALPMTVLTTALWHRSIARRLSRRWQMGWELALLLPLLAVLLWVCLYWGNELQPAVWSQWVGEYARGDQYSSKNAIVIALALGIAIAPSIYSLAEDAIFEVPAHLRQASLALGATRIQTLLKVVLVTAYPGIFSAIMLGLSRAFGETMILLMVTGNTPVPDWDLFSGIRTLTANIAIELPESNVGSIHYRILFLTALLLFGFTFVINTAAELIRRHLRRRYQRV